MLFINRRMLDTTMAGNISISELFANRDRDFARLRELMARDARDLTAVPKSNTRYEQRIAQATKNTNLGDAIISCTVEKACGSVFCEHCRKRKQDRLYYSFRKHCNERFGFDEAKASENLRFISVLHGPVMIDDATFEEELLRKLSISVDEMKAKVAKIAKQVKRDGRQIWLRGAIHLEMLDYNMFLFADMAGAHSTKVETIRQFLSLIHI